MSDATPPARTTLSLTNGAFEVSTPALQTALATGIDPSTVRNSLMPLRVLYRRALARGDVAVSPVTGIELAAVRGRRDRIASPDEAANLIDALPDDIRAV